MESSYGSQMKGQSDGGGEGGYLRWPDFGRVDGWGQAERGRQRGAGVSGESPQQTRVKVIRTRGGGGGTTRQSSKCLRPPPFREGRAPRRHLHSILPTTLHSKTHIACKPKVMVAQEQTQLFNSHLRSCCPAHAELSAAPPPDSGDLRSAAGSACRDKWTK